MRNRRFNKFDYFFCSSDSAADQQQSPDRREVFEAELVGDLAASSQQVSSKTFPCVKIDNLKENKLFENNQEQKRGIKRQQQLLCDRLKANGAMLNKTRVYNKIETWEDFLEVEPGSVRKRWSLAADRVNKVGKPK